MPNVTELIDSWGYAGIFLVVVFGNFGIPVPEETILTVGGYLAWQGQLRFRLVVLVGIASAVVGDNLGYWVGRRYGQRILTRCTAAAPARLERMQRLVLRYGALAVFVARFMAGLRLMAGPLAGSTGLGPLRFFIANFFGALLYVPVVVTAGYAIGYGFGDRIERLRQAAGHAERVVLIALALAVLLGWLMLAVRARRRAGSARDHQS